MSAYTILYQNNCKYFTVKEIQEYKQWNNLNIFHNNINGLETKHDLLQQFLTNLTQNFDIITITETGQKAENPEFISNINIDNYINFSTPSLSNKGGTAIYVKSKYTVKERLDLKVMNQHFETIWIEIKNLRSKNIVCGSVYRHPHNNRHTYKAFLDYMDYTISKLANENKELYICGDFNIDLHKLDQEENSNLFYELMVAMDVYHK